MRPLLVLLPTLAACGPDKAAPSHDSPPTDSPVESEAPPPTGDSIDDPVPVTDLTGTTPVSEAIDPAGDEDWFAVALAEGELLRVQSLSVTGDPNDPDFDCDGTYDTNPIDLVLEIYDPEGALVASADDWALTQCGTDAIAEVRATSAGTWTVRVMDWNNWEDGGGRFDNPLVGDASYTYDLYVRRDDASSLDTEPNDTLATAQPLDGEAAGALGADDTDWWRVTLTDATRLYIYHSTGTNASEDPTLTLYNESGEAVASVSRDVWGATWGIGLLYPATAGTWYVAVSGEDGGDLDDWYWLWTLSDDETPTTRAEEPDDAGTALDMQDGYGYYGDQYSAAWLDGWFETDDDVDRFTLEAEAGDRIYLHVYTSEYGSALEPEIRVIDVDGLTVLEQGDAGLRDELEAGPLDVSGTVTVEIRGLDGGAGADHFYVGALERWISRRPW